MPQTAPSPAPGSSAPGRGEILTASTDLFAESGYDAVSIQAIAQRAGTSKANVFHHFGSKESLYLEVMQQACGGFATATELAEEMACDHAARVEAFLRGDMEQMRADPERAHLILREVLESGPSRSKKLASDVFDEHFRLVVALFRDGQKAGVFAADIEPETAAIMMIAAGVFVFQSRHVLRHLVDGHVVDDPERYAGQMARILLNGMRAQPGQSR